MPYNKEVILKVIPIENINEGDRARKVYENIQELGLSIAAHGIIQPIAVVQMSENKYDLLAGGRRFKAIKGYTKFKEIPCRVFSKGMSARKRRVIELEENLQREDLTYAEKCSLTSEIHEHFQKLARDKGGANKEHSMRDTAKALNVSIGTVSADIAMAKMIKAAPVLGEQKNQAEATKIVNKFRDKLSVKEIAEKIAKEKVDTPVKIQKKKLRDSYLIMDFFKGVKTIPDNTVTFADVDPDWGIDFMKNKKDANELVDEYVQVSVQKFDTFSIKVVKELWRVMKEGSWGIFWHGSEYTNFLHKVLEEKGFYVEPCPGLWIKDKGGNRNPDLKLSKAYEQFLYFRKGQARLSSSRLGRSTNFEFRQPPKRSRIHPTEKPIELMDELLETFVGGTKGVILVPFAGGGNTLLACNNAGHIGFGFDLAEQYKDGFILKVENGTVGKYKSYK